MRNICHYIVFLSIVFTYPPILFAIEMDVDQSLHLAHRNEARSLNAQQGKMESILLDVDGEVLTSLYLNRLDEVIIPVLDEDVIFKKISHRVRKNTTTWIGKNVARRASILLTLGKNHFFGRVVVNDATILFKPTKIPFQAISYEVDDSYEIPLIDDEVIPLEESKRSEELPYLTESADDGSRIDVMVIYTNGMANAYPGSQIDTRIQYLIDLANLSYSNSNINTELNLVYSFMVNYLDDSPGGMNEALVDLRSNSGVFANVEMLRTTYSADQVTLLRQYVDEGCGFGYLLTSDNARYAYAIAHDGDKTDGSGNFCSELTYAHEIGHNLGCAHDRANASGSGRFPYSYGYQDLDGEFSTVMAYSDNCPGLGTCPTIQYFSNPNVTFAGKPTGVADSDPNSADNAKTINQTRLEMAGYRTSVQPSITIIAPNGSELWQRGRTYNIRWTSFNLSESVIIELYRGGNFDSMVTSNAPNNGSYSWPIPLSQSLGSDFSIKIMSGSAPEIYDESDNNFSITEIIKAMPWIPLLLFGD